MPASSHFFRLIHPGAISFAAVAFLLLWLPPAGATPSNKKEFSNHLEGFLSSNLDTCAVCHVADRPDGALDLEHFPHNPFGKRLRALALDLSEGERPSISGRIQQIADEDADGDGIANLTEILLGSLPGDKSDKPEEQALERSQDVREKYRSLVENGYKWRPFQPVTRPEVPGAGSGWAENPIDRFVAEQHELRGLKPRPAASAEIVLRRVYLNLSGLSPTPEKLEEFDADPSPEAYEKVVDKLLDSTAYGERWGRHWMDIWRYADWGGYKKEVRFSQPHIWRWRDWIIESLNEDKPYDEMLRSMLAADELYSENRKELRATGYLVRNYNRNRVQWLDDVVEHSGKAFLGLTTNCAKCHDHIYDPISMEEYYRLRAIFEPYNVRTDPVQGELDPSVNGLVRAFDKSPGTKTFVFQDGDDRFPLKEHPISPGVPEALGGTFSPEEIELSRIAREPMRQEFAREALLDNARDRLEKADSDNAKKAAEANITYLEALFDFERHEDEGMLIEGSGEWSRAASAIAQLKTESEMASAQWKSEKAAADLQAAGKDKAKVDAAKKAAAEAKKLLAEAEKKLQGESKFTPRTGTDFPERSTGRRAAFANWLADAKNPLTARVAVNHIWLRHFGTGLVPTPDDFGGNGRPPSHPALLDWLAAELIESGWSMKHIHKLIVTSATYRLSGTDNPDNAAKDPDNRYLWRAPVRRMEGELVRDNLLHIAGLLDRKQGGPEIPHTDAEKSRRRSVYLRHGREKTVEFIQIFDGPKVSECYQRNMSVAPHQALALANSKLTANAAEALEKSLPKSSEFIPAAFRKILGRNPNHEERALCEQFLMRGNPDDAPKVRRRFLSILFNHNDFITIR